MPYDRRSTKNLGWDFDPFLLEEACASFLFCPTKNAPEEFTETSEYVRNRICGPAADALWANLDHSVVALKRQPRTGSRFPSAVARAVKVRGFNGVAFLQSTAIDA